MKSKVVLWSAVTDVLCIVIFVAIGRENHDEGGSASGFFQVAAPFLIATVVGWLASQAWKKPLDLRTGAVIWLTTIILGMILRHFVFDDGTATAFIIVATVFLCVFLNGWRAIVRKRLNPAQQ
jgi:ribose/xylose/arabinose/galactoside ABC-type transport system permease subunit